jgi:hypothetical protein
MLSWKALILLGVLGAVGILLAFTLGSDTLGNVVALVLQIVGEALVFLVILAMLAERTRKRRVSSSDQGDDQLGTPP